MRHAFLQLFMGVEKETEIRSVNILPFYIKIFFLVFRNEVVEMITYLFIDMRGIDDFA